MRCLYCGKELALFKRLAGGAEFCSDTHRKQYQKEYNELALSRLLQSQPVQPPNSANRDAPPAVVEPDPVPAPVSAAPEAPEFAGFLLHAPSIAEPAATGPARGCEPPATDPVPLALPHWDFRPEGVYDLPWASRLAWSILTGAVPAVFEPKKNRLDFRDWRNRGVAAFPAAIHAARKLALPASYGEPLKAPYVARPLPLACPASEPMLGVLTEPGVDIVKDNPAPEPESPATLAPREPFTDPPPAAPPTVILDAAAPIEVRFPPPSALPLRPAMILKPVAQHARVAASASSPVQLPLSSPVPGPESPKVEIPSHPGPPDPTPQTRLPELRMVENKGPWARLPFALKAALAACLAIAIAGVAYSALQSANATAKPLPAKWEAGRPIDGNGWIDDWAPADPLRRVTLLRGTEKYSNYRLEFTAQIQTKAIGWMFRGVNPRNYYVAKIEKITPGLDPVVAFVRYAVIDGKNEKRVEKVLPARARADTAYKIRFDAIGSRFAAWVQGQKIDEWEDERLSSGGLGLYSEGDEAPAMQSAVNAYELVDGGEGR